MLTLSYINPFLHVIMLLRLLLYSVIIYRVCDKCYTLTTKVVRLTNYWRNSPKNKNISFIPQFVCFLGAFLPLVCYLLITLKSLAFKGLQAYRTRDIYTTITQTKCSFRGHYYPYLTIANMTIYDKGGTAIKT